MSVHSGPKIPIDKLKFIVDTGNLKSYPGSGTIWTDLSSNKIVLNSQGTTTPLTTANGATCFQFNDSGYWSSNTTDGQKTDLRFGATLIFWFRPTNTYIDRDTIFEKTGTVTNSYNQELAITIETSMQFTYYRNQNTSIISGTDYDSASSGVVFGNLGIWVHTAITLGAMPGGVGKVYKNGVLVSSDYNLRTSSNTAVQAGAINIGSGYSGQCESGNFSLFKIYEKVLTDNEILQDFNSTKSRFGI